MKFVEQISRLSVIFIILTLMMTSSALAIDENIDEIMTKGEVHALDVGSIYIYNPDQTYQRDEFTISLLFFQTNPEELVQGEIFLYRNNEQLVSVNSANDLDNGDTYLLMEWNENFN